MRNALDVKSYTVEGYAHAIWAEIERQGLLVNNGRDDLGWTGRSWRPTCGALTVIRGEAELPDCVLAVAKSLADGERQEAIELAGGNPRVVAALGHNPIPLPND